MTSKLKGRAKLTQKQRQLVGDTAQELCKQVMIDGLSQFTVEGIVEAQWKIAGISNLLHRLGAADASTACMTDAVQMESLLNTETGRAEVWQNLKDAMEENKDK